MTIAGIERPFHHGPGHNRKAWHKRMIFNEKTSYFVVGIGDDFSTRRKNTHLQALLVFWQTHVGTALAPPFIICAPLSNQSFCLGMHSQVDRKSKRLNSSN